MSSTTENALAGCITSICVGALTALFGGWMLMLAAGIGHSYAPAVPLLPYWPSVGIFYIARVLIGGLFRVNITNKATT